MTNEEIIERIERSRGHVVRLSSMREGEAVMNALLRGEVPLKGAEVGFVLPPNKRVAMGHTVEGEILFSLLCRKEERAEILERLEAVLARFDLTAIRSRPLDELDESSRFRAALAAACAHEPTVVLICDSFEVFSPGDAKEIQTLLGRLAANGAAVLLSPSKGAVASSSSQKTRRLPAFLSETETILSRLPVAWGIIALLLYAVGMIFLHTLVPVVMMGLLPLGVLLSAPRLIKRSVRLLLPLLPLLVGLLLIQFLWGGYGTPIEVITAWSVITLKLLFMTILSLGLLLSVSRARMVEGISTFFAPLKIFGLNVRELSAVPVIALRALPEIIALIEQSLGERWRGERWVLFGRSGLAKTLRALYAEILGHGERIGLTLAVHGFGSSKRPFTALKRDGSPSFGVLVILLTAGIVLLALEVQRKGAVL